jgi:hypothetical protein
MDIARTFGVIRQSAGCNPPRRGTHNCHLAGSRTSGVKGAVPGGEGILAVVGYQLTNEARRGGARVAQERADARAADLAPLIRELQAVGVTSVRAIADALNRRRIATPRDCRWYAGSVARLLARIGA